MFKGQHERSACVLDGQIHQTVHKEKSECLLSSAEKSQKKEKRFQNQIIFGICLLDGFFSLLKSSLSFLKSASQ